MSASAVLMAATILSRCRARLVALAAPRGPFGVQLLTVIGLPCAVVEERAAAGTRVELVAGGREEVEHVERRQLEVAAHVGRGGVAGAAVAELGLAGRRRTDDL